MNTFDEIFKKINDYSTIIIHRHQHPDPDALGSQAGLARSLKLAFPEKRFSVLVDQKVIWSGLIKWMRLRMKIIKVH